MTNDPYGPPAYPPPAGPQPTPPGYPPPSWPQGAVPPAPAPGAYPSLVGTYPGPVGTYPTYGPVPGWSPDKPSAMPDGPREYHQLLRGPRQRWWRPLLALVVAFGIALPLWILGVVPVIVAGLVVGVAQPVQWAIQEMTNTADLSPAGFLYLNLTLIALIPAAGLSVWIVHRIRPRYLASVRGRIRWRWLLRCLIVVVPVWAVYLGVSALFEPPASARPAQWGLLLVIVVVLTPLQAAGEEYFFRGWIMQNVGSWFRNPTVGLVLGLAVSVVSFSWAHGSPDIWVLGSLAVFALTAGLATWWTGGLEAGIAIHAVNNVGVFFMVILLGGWQDAFVGADTKGAPVDVLIALVVHGVVLALIVWQAKKSGIERRYLPPAVVAAPQPPFRPEYSQPLPGL